MAGFCVWVCLLRLFPQAPSSSPAESTAGSLGNRAAAERGVGLLRSISPPPPSDRAHTANGGPSKERPERVPPSECGVCGAPCMKMWRVFLVCWCGLWLATPFTGFWWWLASWLVLGLHWLARHGFVVDVVPLVWVGFLCQGVVVRWSCRHCGRACVRRRTTGTTMVVAAAATAAVVALVSMWLSCRCNFTTSTDWVRTPYVF